MLTGMIYFQSLTKEELAELLLPMSYPPKRRQEEATEAGNELKARKRALLRARMIYQWVYQRFVDDWDLMTDLSKDMRAWLKENVVIHRLSERVSQQATDGTYKFLWNLHDNRTIESVIIPAGLESKSYEEAFEDVVDGSAFAGKALPRAAVERPAAHADWDQWSRLTACISSQVGCAMGCKFCLTGIQGLDRNLEVHEIVTQIHELRRRAPITNIVFMGMGEPLHNLQNVIKACEIFLDQDGFNFSKRKVTVSTSGLVPAIDELGKRVDVSLAISLNGTTDEQRAAVMPVNKKWNIEALLEACRRYPLGPHRRITFEYVMLAGINDSLEDAERLTRLLRTIPNKINLIPFNAHPGSDYRRPTDATIKAFQRYLVDRNFTATVRISRGRDILAACGQLRSLFGTARGTDRHRDYPSVVNSSHGAAPVS